MARFCSTPPVAGAPGEVYTTLINPVMAIATDELGYEYLFLAGCTSCVAGDAVTFDENGVTALLTGNAVGPVAIATAACDATTKWSWYGRKGTFAANFVAASADNTAVGKETTNGKLGDGRSAGDQIANCVARGTTGPVQIYFPYVDDFQGA